MLKALLKAFVDVLDDNYKNEAFKKHIEAKSRLECKNHNLFETKTAKIDTLFLTKTAKKHTLWTAHTYIAHIREYPPEHPQIRVHVLHCLPFYCCRCTNGIVKIPLSTVTYRLSPVGLAGLVSLWGVFVIPWTYSSVIQVVWRRRRQLKSSATLIS